MKKLFFTLLLPAVLLAGCSKDDNNHKTDEPVAVQFTAGATVMPDQTKVGGEDGTIWDAGDPIGIYMIGATGSLTADNIIDGAANCEYTASAAGETTTFMPSAGDIYYPADGSDVRFVAYHPYNAEVGADFILPIDLSDQTNQSAIDLLYAPAGTDYNKSVTTVPLDFTHELVKLNMTLVPDAGVTAADLVGATIQITNQQTAGSFNLATEELTVTAGTPMDLTAAATADGESAEALVMPGSTDGVQFVVTTTAGKVYVATPDESTWEAKGKYGYTIHIGAQTQKLDITGEWHLTQWVGERPEGFDVYMAFAADNTFDIYQQLASVDNYDHYTGTWNLEGTLFTGEYSDGTPWSSDYDIALDDTGETLTMTSTLDPNDINVYSKTPIPDDIKTGSTTVSATRAMRYLPL